MSKKSEKKFPVQYQRTKVRVPSDKPIKKGICEGCGFKGETHLHHHKYAYRAATVKKNPKLALENTCELCYACHLLGNSLMTLFRRKEDSMEIIVNIAELMPEDMRQKMDMVARMWLARREKKHLNTTSKEDRY